MNKINPELFSTLGVIVALIMEGDYSISELNAIGNWFELVGQFMLTTAAQRQVVSGNQNINVK